MLYPEDLNQYEPMTPELDPLVLDKALSVVENMVQPFNPDTYNNVIADRVIAASSADFDPTALSTADESRSTSIDLADALDSFLS